MVTLPMYLLAAFVLACGITGAVAAPVEDGSFRRPSKARVSVVVLSVLFGLCGFAALASISFAI